MSISKNITGEYYVVSAKGINPVYDSNLSEALKKAFEQLSSTKTCE